MSAPPTVIASTPVRCSAAEKVTSVWAAPARRPSPAGYDWRWVCVVVGTAATVPAGVGPVTIL